jgi:hypothetical protein
MFSLDFSRSLEVLHGCINQRFESGSRRAKITNKKEERKKLKKLHVLKCCMFSFEG